MGSKDGARERGTGLAAGSGCLGCQNHGAPRNTAAEEGDGTAGKG